MTKVKFGDPPCGCDDQDCEDWYNPKLEELLGHVNELKRRRTMSKLGLRPEPARALPAEIPLLAANGNIHD